MSHYGENYENQADKYAKEFKEIQERNRASAMKELKDLGYTSNQIEEVLKHREIQKILDYYKL